MNGPQFADPDADEDSEEEPTDLGEESEPETVDYRDGDDDDDESDRGSGCPPSRTRVSDWLTEFPDFIEEIHEGLEEAGVKAAAMPLASMQTLQKT